MTISPKKDWEHRWESGYYRTIPDEIENNRKTAQGRISLELLKRFPKGSKVLEAGCGLGVWDFLFEEMGFQSYGVDFSEAAIKAATQYAKEKGLHSQFYLGDLRKLPFENNFFDAIVSYGAIEHFDDSENAVKEFFRVLRPGGACLVTTPNPFNFHRLIGRHYLNMTKSAKLGYVGKENDFTPKALAKMFKDTGFKDVRYGIVDEGLLFGMFWQYIPIVGSPLYCVFQKISRFIERIQPLAGTASYAIGYK